MIAIVPGMEDDLLARCRMAMKDGEEARRSIRRTRDDQRSLLAENWRICREYRARTRETEVELPTTPGDEGLTSEAFPDHGVIRAESDPATIELMRGLLAQAARFVIAGGPLGAAVALHAAIRSGIDPRDAKAFLVALVMERSEARPIRVQKRRIAQARCHLVAAEAVSEEAALAVAAMLGE